LSETLNDQPVTVDKTRIALIGLGYVGLPLAVEFARHYPVAGFDINKARVAELRAGKDSTLEVDAEELASVLTASNPLTSDSGTGLYVSSGIAEIARASETVGQVLKKGDIVIYESTVCSAATEEDCVPVLERVSGLCFNRDFFAGDSPERINPGDKEHTVAKIKKVTSGSTFDEFLAARTIEELYAGVHEVNGVLPIDVIDGRL